MVIVRIWQGLGNQLFQYAFAKAVQLKNNQEVYLDTNRAFINSIEWNVIQRDYSLDKFNISIPSIDDVESRFSFLEKKNICQRVKYWLACNGIGKLKYDEYLNTNLNDIGRIAGNRYMMGYFQNPHFFEDIRDVLIKDLSLKEELVLPNGIHSLISDDQSVSVHIRRGDFVRFDMNLTEKYYIKAINYIKKIVERPKFVVFSDDIEWAKENELFSGRDSVLYIENSFKDYEELIIMSRCSNNIIANSTFSWWAAWLNQNPDKIVVAPKQWFPDQDDIMPEKWIVID